MAVVTAFFGAGWFGWGQAAASGSLRPWLGAGSGIAVLVAAAGIVTTARHRSTRAALSDRAAFRRYGIIMGIEFGAAALGAAVLAVLSQSAYIPVWVCAVVGVHFIPLAQVLRDRSLVPLAAATCAVAACASFLRSTAGGAPSTTTGLGEGCLLTAFAAVTLLSVSVGSVRPEAEGSS